MIDLIDPAATAGYHEGYLAGLRRGLEFCQDARSIHDFGAPIAARLIEQEIKSHE